MWCKQSGRLLLVVESLEVHLLEILMKLCTDDNEVELCAHSS